MHYYCLSIFSYCLIMNVQSEPIIPYSKILSREVFGTQNLGDFSYIIHLPCNYVPYPAG